jgi:hypothetical protein
MVDRISTGVPAHLATYQGVCNHHKALERLGGETQSLTQSRFTSPALERRDQSAAYGCTADGWKEDKEQYSMGMGTQSGGTLNGSFRGLIPVSETSYCLAPAKLVKPVHEGRGRRPMQHNGHRNHQSQHGP